MTEFGRRRSYLEVTTEGRKEVKVGTLLLGSNKNKVILNYLFKLLGLNGYLEGDLKSR